ncbi:response regulator transcription factor [Octadecabacter ascidiaceicola]|uniref:Transcriptional regulatory protein OmpR n=1 Tax=Octadecabacter ascidiaceicola TaxID=1655543 RepID=A0A238JM97_9RHOB|nr:response regulator transcription factor [Octadecabacter ascidiaceicola]SMX30896.1 Transcriptional regulatory protein OmpR [Octadecabacter ascidiaceicola]
MTDPIRVSVLEDSIELQRLLVDVLSGVGYDVRAYGRARDFEEDFDKFQPKVCVIDLGLPDKDGLGLLNKISLERDTAVLVVSGRSSLTDKIAGLELGADDYLAKPFEMPELVARIKALLRRSNTPAPKRQSIHTVGNVTVDLSRFTLADSTGKEERLSASEVAILTVFLDNPNRLVTRDKLREELQDRSDQQSFDRAIDVRVSRLRSKLKDSPKTPKIIKTVYGAGYILISEAD